ncbi:MAG: sigma-70 family RNA polymerase sigma factor [Ruminococcaceae bacterium]|nr:sigma-70 family RNA polymerase sigma factor [Oscillospiraceae bacterium]
MVREGGRAVSDEELYRAYLAGDEAGLRQLMERYGDSLTLYLNGYVHDLSDAEDLMVEAFARTVRAKPKLTENTFRAYLYKTGRHLAQRFYAWRTRSQTFSFEELEREPESGALLETTVTTRDKRRILHLCMEKLDPALREALWLVYFEGMSYAESARVMNKTPKQLDHLLQKGKKLLREELEKEGITDAEY